MGRTNIGNIQKNEIFGEELQKYPFLYGKSDKGY